MSASAGSGGIPFIVPDASGRLVVTAEARSFLASLGGGPVAPIAVLGKYRTGKSFLMNNLVGAGGRGGAKAAGFDVGATVEACTKGVWLWCARRRALRAARREPTDVKRRVLLGALRRPSRRAGPSRALFAQACAAARLHVDRRRRHCRL
jgi:hypothetical protein